MGPQKVTSACGSLSNLTVKLQKKLQKSCIVVKRIRGHVRMPRICLCGMIVGVEQEGEELEFVSHPGMRKAERLGTRCEQSCHVALNRQQSAVCGHGDQQ